VPNTHWAYSGSVVPLPHDTTGARALLAESGYSDRDGDGVVENEAGEALRLTLLLPAGSDFNRDLAQVLQSDLADVGVRLELRPLEFGTLVQVITGAEREFDAVLLGLTADPRLDLRSLFHSESMDNPFQLAGYANPVVDSLLDAIETAEGGRAVDLWAEVQEVLAQDQPWTFLHGGTELIVARDRLQGITPRLLASAGDWWVEK
jgi:peptide/nickel transport system substrate-binding protein